MKKSTSLIKKNLLSVANLTITSKDSSLVNNLSFQLLSGETLAIVGESGSGKSLSSLAILGLLPDDLTASGKILFEDKSLLNLAESDYCAMRGKEMAMIFQEPMTALNPSMKLGKQVAEVLLQHYSISAEKAKNKVLALFEKVELPRPKELYNSYPHQISGGQKQRVMIAMAIACKPKLLIADEPTTALDASVQKGILLLLKNLCKEFGMALIFISHDLGVVRHVADRILVMYKGKLIESNSSEQLFKAPQEAYTRGLLACRPTPDTSFIRLPVVDDFLDGKRPKLKLRSAEAKLSQAEKRTIEEPLFEVVELDKEYKGKSGFGKKANTVLAVKEVSFKIFEGESLGLVGESGSGKTTLGRILVGLEAVTKGNIFYKGKDISEYGKADWRQLHREIQIIFQDPFSSLNPRKKIGETLMEVMQVQKKFNRGERRQKSLTLLEKVGLLSEHFDRYPHEFSGGQRQRIGIARALAVNPKFIVCDESVSALDVSVQAQVLNLLNDLKDEYNFTYLFISHDLAVVKYFADRIVVLKNGELVEKGYADQVYQNPKTTYTTSLIDASF